MTDPAPIRPEGLGRLPPDELADRRRLAVTRDLARGIRHPRKRAFLEAFSTSGNITLAAQAAGVGRSTHYIWLREDPAYVEAYHRAQEIAVDLLEAIARERAVNGTQEPVFHRGQVVGHIVRTHDMLLLALLKAHRPEVWDRKASLELTGPGGGPILVEENLDRLAEKLREARRLPPVALPPGTVIDVEAEEA